MDRSLDPAGRTLVLPFRWGPVLFLLTILVACDEAPAAPSSIRPAAVLVELPTGGVWPPGAIVTARVRVVDSAGAGVPGVEVGWSVPAGRGTVTPASVTDRSGRTTVFWSLSEDPGSRVEQLRAEVTLADGTPASALIEGRTSGLWLAAQRLSSEALLSESGGLVLVSDADGRAVFVPEGGGGARAILGPPGTVSVRARRVNGSGTVVGWVELEDGSARYFAWSEGTMELLGDVPATGYPRIALNESGDLLFLLMDGNRDRWILRRGNERTEVLLPVDHPWVCPGFGAGLSHDLEAVVVECYASDPCALFDLDGGTVRILGAGCRVMGLSDDGVALRVWPGEKPPWVSGWDLVAGATTLPVDGVVIAEAPFRTPGWSVGGLVAAGGVSTGWAAGRPWAPADPPEREPWLIVPPHEYQVDAILRDRQWRITEILAVNGRAQLVVRAVDRETLEAAVLLLSPTASPGSPPR